MTKNSISMNFGVDFIIEIVNLEGLKIWNTSYLIKHHRKKMNNKTMIWEQKLVFWEFSLRSCDLCCILVGIDGAHNL